MRAMNIRGIENRVVEMVEEYAAAEGMTCRKASNLFTGDYRWYDRYTKGGVEMSLGVLRRVLIMADLFWSDREDLKVPELIAEYREDKATYGPVDIKAAPARINEPALQCGKHTNLKKKRKSTKPRKRVKSKARG